MNPLQQGLKLVGLVVPIYEPFSMVAIMNPLQQGLKLTPHSVRH